MGGVCMVLSLGAPLHMTRYSLLFIVLLQRYSTAGNRWVKGPLHCCGLLMLARMCILRLECLIMGAHALLLLEI
jgi:hypothetical protein